MQIIEIYKSLQGESSYAGLPCVFVRTAGCNLRCVWCDSEYTFKGGQRMTLDEIVHEVHRLSPDGGLVEITGGEPMLQEGEVLSLMDRLLITGFTVLLETSGERLLDKVPPRVVKIVDVKCPHSGEGGTFRHDNLRYLTARDEVKFVLASRSRLRVCARFYPRTRIERPGRIGDSIAGVSQGCDGQQGCFALSAGPSGTGGMDAGRRAEGAAGTADS